MENKTGTYFIEAVFMFCQEKSIDKISFVVYTYQG